MKRVLWATLLSAPLGAAAGALSALFLWGLALVTGTREAHPALLYALPVVGLAFAFVGRRAPWLPGGSGVVFEACHGGTRVPWALAPLVLVGTWVAHLFGASVGREGTAVQMSAAVADALAVRAPTVRPLLLRAGLAGGFGAVFGTPFAGAAFGLEAPTFARVDLAALLPCLVASFVGDRAAVWLGAKHSTFPHVAWPSWDAYAKVVVVGVAAGLAVIAFVELVGVLKKAQKKSLFVTPLAGLATVAGTLALGTTAYLGLGVPTIEQAFTPAAIPPAAFAWKLLFTAVCVGGGFLGGEVTPLFFVGATLGHTLARPLGLPVDLAAAAGMAAVFGGAANTPVALAVMVGELCGVGALPAAGIAAFAACVLSGPRGIYASQRVAWDKRGRVFEEPVRVGDLGGR